MCTVVAGSRNLCCAIRQPESSSIDRHREDPQSGQADRFRHAYGGCRNRSNRYVFRVTRIDLHCHSTASDGTLTPAELVVAGAAAGLDVLAITDHDTTGGWAAAAAARPDGVPLVRGAELPCRWYGEQPSIALHLLAYLFDPDEPRL